MTLCGSWQRHAMSALCVRKSLPLPHCTSWMRQWNTRKWNTNVRSQFVRLQDEVLLWIVFEYQSFSRQSATTYGNDWWGDTAEFRIVSQRDSLNHQRSVLGDHYARFTLPYNTQLWSSLYDIGLCCSRSLVSDRALSRRSCASQCPFTTICGDCATGVWIDAREKSRRKRRSHSCRWYSCLCATSCALHWRPHRQSITIIRHNMDYGNISRHDWSWHNSTLGRTYLNCTTLAIHLSKTILFSNR